jgi:hypothetical protein
VCLLGLTAVSCVTRAAIDARVWKGDHVEAGIVRDVRCSDGKPGCEEFLPASAPVFDQMRCVTADDLNKLIEQALKNCSGSAGK